MDGYKFSNVSNVSNVYLAGRTVKKEVEGKGNETDLVEGLMWNVSVYSSQIFFQKMTTIQYQQII